MKAAAIHRRLAGWALLLVCTAMSVSASEPQDELKAAVVLTFLRYSEWPEPAARGPLTVGVVGRPSLRLKLKTVLEDRQVNDRPVLVRELRPPFDPKCCQVVYVATNKLPEMEEALAGVHGHGPVLTIGESERFLEIGGMVNLTLVDGHMSFVVNLDAVDRAGVQISSRLLRLGTVKGKRP